MQIACFLLNLVPIPKGNELDRNAFAMAIYFTSSQEFIRKMKRIARSLDQHFSTFLLCRIDFVYVLKEHSVGLNGILLSSPLF